MELLFAIGTNRHSGMSSEVMPPHCQQRFVDFQMALAYTVSIYLSEERSTRTGSGYTFSPLPTGSGFATFFKIERYRLLIMR